MNVVTFPHPRGSPAAHLLMVFVDLQQEYASAGRAYAIDNLDGCLIACANLMRVVRDLRLTIAHFRQLRPEPCFNIASPYADWIEGFRPRASEAVFERALPSIYANADFCTYVGNIDAPTILVAGLSAERACLASAIDAYHRGHRLVFIEDCSASAPIGGLSEARSHECVTDLIGRFVDVTRSADLIELFDEPRRLVRKRVP